MPNATNQTENDMSSAIAEGIVLSGRLQGMGVRPAIFRLATQLGLVGHVRNTAQGVEIHIEGSPNQTEAFRRQLRGFLPAEAQILSEQSREVPPIGRARFEIVRENTQDSIVTTVPLDTAVCRECLDEIYQPGNRRFLYPFNSCARCGPRYTIIRQMPFERNDTAMVDFPWCEDCYAEYRSADDRRFHAQTISCPNCGPRLWGISAGNRRFDDEEEALGQASQAILRGLIIALKGLGGYQLLVDATNPDAVERLRLRKGRISKPFAVMMRTLSEVDQVAKLDSVERQVLVSATNPIVLLDLNQETIIVPGVHPGLNTVGIMLPTTPLHDLLLKRVGRPLVCTSGNREGEPLAFEVENAEAMLSGICDLWLHHNRSIARPVDDSVVRIVDGNRVALRLARGMAPLRLDLDTNETQMALGGQMKSSVAWSHDGSAFLGPHIGDLSNLAVQERYQWHLADWQSLYRFSATQAVHDRHPGYYTTHAASREFSVTQSVQHHHAHICSAMLEHHLLDQQVLGVAWDGTGYGMDQTVWGGEFFLADKHQYSRIAHVRPFALPGGETAILQPWRITLSLLSQLDSVDSFDLLPVFESLRLQLSLVEQILDSPQFSPITTSGGRLFDGVAALILNRQQSEYEGQLPMMLEAIADPEEKGAYEFTIAKQTLVELDWRSLISQVLADVEARVSPDRMSMRFHRGVANAIMAICRQHADLPVVLTGGVFQNRLLAELIADMSKGQRPRVYLPGIIPPGDGGLAAGQLVAAYRNEAR